MRTIGGRGDFDYERVVVDEWLQGEIAEVQYDENHSYSVKDQTTGEWSKAASPHVRFKFKLDGYKYFHYSRWMKASTFVKANLYAKYLKYLCPKYDCEDKLIDLDKLTGVKVKIMWENSDNGDYQNVSQVRGFDPELNIIASPLHPAEREVGERAETEALPDDEAPF